MYTRRFSLNLYFCMIISMCLYQSSVYALDDQSDGIETSATTHDNESHDNNNFSSEIRWNDDIQSQKKLDLLDPQCKDDFKGAIDKVSKYYNGDITCHNILPSKRKYMGKSHVIMKVRNKHKYIVLSLLHSPHSYSYEYNSMNSDSAIISIHPTQSIINILNKKVTTRTITHIVDQYTGKHFIQDIENNHNWSFSGADNLGTVTEVRFPNTGIIVYTADYDSIGSARSRRYDPSIDSFCNKRFILAKPYHYIADMFRDSYSEYLMKSTVCHMFVAGLVARNPEAAFGIVTTSYKAFSWAVREPAAILYTASSYLASSAAINTQYVINFGKAIIKSQYIAALSTYMAAIGKNKWQNLLLRR